MISCRFRSIIFDQPLVLSSSACTSLDRLYNDYWKYSVCLTIKYKWGGTWKHIIDGWSDLSITHTTTNSREHVQIPNRFDDVRRTRVWYRYSEIIVSVFNISHHKKITHVRTGRQTSNTEQLNEHNNTHHRSSCYRHINHPGAPAVVLNTRYHHIRYSQCRDSSAYL